MIEGGGKGDAWVELLGVEHHRHQEVGDSPGLPHHEVTNAFCIDVIMRYNTSR